MVAAQPWTRAAALAAADETPLFDVAVVGGGIVAAGVTLDLAARGFSVFVAEAADFGGATSRRSTKLLHGGIRYLPQFRFGLVREGLLEQKVLARTADYLFQPLEFVLPLYQGRGFGDVPRWVHHPRVVPIAFKFGLWFYDRLGRRSDLRHRTLTAAEVLEAGPRLRHEGLRKGFSYFDAQTDDVRLTLAVLKTAVDDYDAVAVNHTPVQRMDRFENGYRLTLDDDLAGASFEVRARGVVAATGPFEPPAPAGGEVKPVTVSKGVHLVMEANELGIGTKSVVLPETEDERVIFLVPWHGKVWVGTTDTPYHGSRRAPQAAAEDIDYLMRHIRLYMDVSSPQVVTAVAGLRALAATGGPTSKASREAVIAEVAPRYLQVAGGKLTGYRPMAAKVGTRLSRALRSRAPSPTADVHLTGSGADTTKLIRRAGELGLSEEYGRALYRRYGGNADGVLDLITDDPELGTILTENAATVAEAIHTARTEAVATLGDFLLRRTHVGWLSPDHGRAAAATVTPLLARELGWSETEMRRQLNGYEAEIAAEGL